ncbi:MAG: ribosome biogenesis GTPase YlqF [Syntrophomonadaceae bacterium]
MSINWYPGHMVRAKREINENLKLVDIVAIILDARAPFSCRNRELENMVGKKPVLMVLNKSDLAAPNLTRQYLESLRAEGFLALAMDSLHRKGKKTLLEALKTAYQTKSREMLAKGRRVRPARVMVAGVPNTGKSTFLNCLVGRNTAATGARPGITRGKQWVRIQSDMELLDTPGVMWPKIDNPEQGLKLALLDIVGQNAYNEVEVACYLLEVLKMKGEPELLERSGLNVTQDTATALQAFSLKKRFCLPGGSADEEKTAHFLLQEFRKGRLGRISLD